MSTMSIYRLYREDGALLYIGASFEPKRRSRDHRRKIWGHEIARVEIEENSYEHREALAREHDAIFREQPIHNVASKNGLTADQMARKAGADAAHDLAKERAA